MRCAHTIIRFSQCHHLDPAVFFTLLQHYYLTHEAVCSPTYIVYLTDLRAMHPASGQCIFKLHKLLSGVTHDAGV